MTLPKYEIAKVSQAVGQFTGSKHYYGQVIKISRDAIQAKRKMHGIDPGEFTDILVQFDDGKTMKFTYDELKDRLI